MLNIAEEERRKKGFELNNKKAEVMVVSRKNECLQINIFVKRNITKLRDQCQYLGSFTLCDGRNNIEIVPRIAQAK